jgi:hypothetical protein
VTLPILINKRALPSEAEVIALELQRAWKNPGEFDALVEYSDDPKPKTRATQRRKARS